MCQKYLIFVCFAFFLSQTYGSPTQTSSTDTTLEEMRSLCNDQNDAFSCIKYKALNFINNIYKQDLVKLSDDVEVRKNEYANFVFSGRSDASTMDKIEEYIQSHDVTVNIPYVGAKVTVSPRNLNENELDLQIKFADKVSDVGDARKSKLKKIAIPIMVFVLLKAMTLIPLALGVLGLKAWNALQLSFFSFVISVALAIFQLCKKIATDNHHPHITHAPWEAARFLQQDVPKDISQDLAYNAYI